MSPPPGAEWEEEEDYGADEYDEDMVSMYEQSRGGSVDELPSFSWPDPFDAGTEVSSLSRRSSRVSAAGSPAAEANISEESPFSESPVQAMPRSDKADDCETGSIQDHAESTKPLELHDQSSDACLVTDEVEVDCVASDRGEVSDLLRAQLEAKDVLMAAVLKAIFRITLEDEPVPSRRPGSGRARGPGRLVCARRRSGTRPKRRKPRGKHKPCYEVSEEEFERLLNAGALGDGPDEFVMISEEDFERLLQAGELHPVEEDDTDSEGKPSTAPAALGRGLEVCQVPQSVDFKDAYWPGPPAVGSPLQSARLLRGLRNAVPPVTLPSVEPEEEIVHDRASSSAAGEDAHNCGRRRAPRASPGRLPQLTLRGGPVKKALPSPASKPISSGGDEDEDRSDVGPASRRPSHGPSHPRKLPLC